MTSAPGDAGIVTKASPRSVGDTVARLLELLASKGVKVFVVIDQRAEALAVGLDLRATTLVVFGNPVTGTAVMEATPLAALDLPLKVLVWSGGSGVTQVSYTDPSVPDGALRPRRKPDGGARGDPRTHRRSGRGVGTRAQSERRERGRAGGAPLPRFSIYPKGYMLALVRRKSPGGADAEETTCSCPKK